MKKFTNTTRRNFITYGGVILAYVIMQVLSSAGFVSNSLAGQLIPICVYVAMAVALNLTVGILGELSLGHAGFMSVGAFSGIVIAQSLQAVVASEPLRLLIAVIVLIAGLLIRSMIRGRKAGKSPCGGNCSGCNACTHCGSMKGAATESRELCS